MSPKRTFIRSIFVFRRDLRVEDNRGLRAALDSSSEVIPIFVFDPRQIENHQYRSQPGFDFMLESLLDLQDQLHKHKAQLYFFCGIAEEIIPQIARASQSSAVFFNRDYSPFSKRRDLAIKNNCQAAQVEVLQYADSLIFEPEQALKPDSTPYTVFTPFFKRNSQQEIRPTTLDFPDNKWGKYQAAEPSTIDPIQKFTITPNRLRSVGGRSAALRLLQNLSKLSSYDEQRDFPAFKAGSGLSPYNKFGCLSIREVYWKIADTLGKDHTLIREVFWRDFFTHIGFHFPHVFSGAFHKKYDALAWEENREHWERWCQGETGFPIVDAGMRELNKSGLMHNRVRMIVASFLTKDLHIDWRRGEQYFARKLEDYDPCVNNGNWQWAASTGCDAQPYFRIFNPWLQQSKFDPDCIYIKQWIPELSRVSAAQIHRAYENKTPLVKGYPLPLVDHAIEKQHAEQMYLDCRE